ncbi:MAG: class I SAM-dependent methyltransferase [Armatimonadetes bacterium]|nr:class I SAM-dependent methyltransferase [Armatimonadota bacterium]
MAAGRPESSAAGHEASGLDLLRLGAYLRLLKGAGHGVGVRENILERTKDIADVRAGGVRWRKGPGQRQRHWRHAGMACTREKVTMPSQPERARKIVITGSREKVSRPGGAEWWEERLGAEVVPRGRRTLAQVAAEHGAWGVLVIEAERVRFYVPSEGVEYFYHPGMARRRIRAIVAGDGDPMVTAMGLRPGDRVLDCTLGRGTDAIVTAFVVGPSGRVVGVESVPVLAGLTEHGLATFDAGDERVNEAMRRVEVLCADNAEYLAGVAPGAFDVIYFDPVFHQPVEKSSAMVPLRALADRRPLSIEVIELAREKAGRAVVVKQRKGTPLWQETQPERVVGGRHATVEYGVFLPRRNQVCC